MSVSAVVWAILFSVFSTTIMTYIAIATPMGPWMGPLLALMAIVLIRLIPKTSFSSMFLAVVSGSLGGIMATAFGFSFPTLYFLNKPLFIEWLASPYTFIPSVAAVACAAGALGLWVSATSAHLLLEEQKLAFPVGVLVYKIISAVDNTVRLRQVVTGFMATTLYCFAQATAWVQRCIPSNLVLAPASTVGWFSIPSITLTMGIMPLLWSIGFIAGGMITIPLLIGTLSKIFLVDLVHHWYFPTLSSMEFVLAFCSGMVVVGAVSSLISMPGQLITFVKKTFMEKDTGSSGFAFPSLLVTGLVIGCAMVVLGFFKFSVVSQIYIIFFSVVCAYQIVVIAGKIGLALLGRFATFVMVPGLLIFGFDALQVTILATFVEACGGIATEGLFGRKAGMLAGVDAKKIVKYQILGLVICSITVGIVMWLLMTHFQLGSEQFFAERAQVRALLVNAAHFDYYVLACGAAFGLVLKLLKCNAMLVLGGLLMPVSLTIGLVIGGLSSLVVGKEVDYEPLCSGMLAANSLCMIIQALW